jgi:hypothetical protein
MFSLLEHAKAQVAEEMDAATEVAAKLAASDARWAALQQLTDASFEANWDWYMPPLRTEVADPALARLFSGSQ